MVFAGCCQPLLDGGSSQRFFCMSVPGCLGHDPGGTSGAHACFFPDVIGLPSDRPKMRAAVRTVPLAEISRGEIFDIVTIPSVQASWFVRHPGLPYRYGITPQGSRGFSVRAEPVLFPATASDILD